MNCIDYNPTLDQIVMSVRGNSELWIVDHSTTTAQSAGHSGGDHGKGGDLLYRYGNPSCYGAGTATNQKYFEQHDVEWIKPGCPGAGDLMCFNNGVNRNYSTVDQITPPIDGNGDYSITAGSAYGPENFTWSYQATPPTSLYAHDISGAQRLPNGNTIVCAGPFGHIFEVNPSGTIVWEYINPTTNTGELTQGDTIPHNPVRPEELMNSVFRVYKYGTDYPAFVGRDLTPGDFVEIYPVSINEIGSQNTVEVYPNPTSEELTINNKNNLIIDKITMVDIQGRIVLQKEIDNSNSKIKLNLSKQTKGIYTLQIQSEKSISVKKIVIQ
jgi:hypothetical protein